MVATNMSDADECTIVQFTTYLIPAASHKMSNDKAIECRLQIPSAMQLNWVILCVITHSCNLVI